MFVQIYYYKPSVFLVLSQLARIEYCHQLTSLTTTTRAAEGLDVAFFNRSPNIRPRITHAGFCLMKSPLTGVLPTIQSVLLVHIGHESLVAFSINP